MDFYLQGVFQSVVQFHDGCLVSTAVAVVWSTKDGHHILIMAPVVALQVQSHAFMVRTVSVSMTMSLRWRILKINQLFFVFSSDYSCTWETLILLVCVSVCISGEHTQWEANGEALHPCDFIMLPWIHTDFFRILLHLCVRSMCANKMCGAQISRVWVRFVVF